MPNQPQPQPQLRQRLTEALEWRPVVGYEGSYEVSNSGLVRSLDRVVTRSDGGTRTIKGTMRRQVLTKTGYADVTMSRDGIGRVRKVHHLVLEAFIGPRPDGTVGCHIDGDKLNNAANNLRWDTAQGNTNDSVRHGSMWYQKPDRTDHSGNSVKTHCPRGHPYSGSNLKVYRTPVGGYGRACRECRNEAERKRYWQKKREAAVKAEETTNE